MSRWSIDPPDDDAYSRGTPCLTPGCEHNVSLPEWDTYCSDCRQRQQDAAEAHERWLAEQERKSKLKASGAAQPAGSHVA